MGFDDSGYYDRWTIPCVDLFGQRQRVIVAFSSTHRGTLQVIAPGSAFLLDAEGISTLISDLKDAAQRLS